MPSRVIKDTAYARLQLPALHFDFGCIADGTDIPPPELSAGQNIHAPPQTPLTKDDTSASQAAVSPEETSSPKNDNRLTVSGCDSMYNLDRSESQSGASLVDERKSKSANNWFRRLRSADGHFKRRSNFFGVKDLSIASQKSIRSLPPVIPELVSLAKDQSSLGDDIFNHIK